MEYTFGARVKFLRKEKQKKERAYWSLKALSSRIDITPQALCLIENDKLDNPSLKIIKGLAKEFKVTSDYLIFGDNADNINIITLEIPSTKSHLSSDSVKITIDNKKSITF